MSDSTSISELAEAYGAPSKPAEKPDDMVERCARIAQAIPRPNAFVAGSESWTIYWRALTRTVLQAAGVERLRAELRGIATIIEAIELAVASPYTAKTELETRLIAIGNAKGLADCVLKSTETALTEAKARIADLEKVADRAEVMRDQYVLLWETAKRVTPLPITVTQFDEAREALDATQPKAEPAKDESSSLPSDDWTGWADEVEEHRHRLAADDRRLNEHSADIVTLARILQGAMGAVSATDLMALRGIIKRNEQ